MTNRQTPLPRLPLVEVAAPSEVVSEPTPLLDAALAKAQYIQDGLLEGPTAAPVPSQPELVEAVPEAPPTPVGVGPGEPARLPVLEPAPSGPPPVPTPAEATPTELPEAPEPPAATQPPDAPPAPVAVARPAVDEPRETWSECLERLRVLAERERLDDPTSQEVWDARQRLLDLLRLEPDPDASALMWDELMAVLAAAEGPAPETPPATPMPAPTPAPPGPTDLLISELALCRKVVAFGSFERLETEACRAGQVILLYCEMVGLVYEPAAEGQVRSRIRSRIEIRPAQGDDVPVWELDLGAAVDLCRQARKDYYVNYRITLPGPETLAPGEYRLVLHQQDTVSGKQAQRELPLRIAAAR